MISKIVKIIIFNTIYLPPEVSENLRNLRLKTLFRNHIPFNTENSNRK